MLGEWTGLLARGKRGAGSSEAAGGHGAASRPAGLDGLVAPDVRPAWLNSYQKFGDEWTSITLAYGQWREPGPYLEVMTTVTDRAVLVSLGLPADQPDYPDEDSLRDAFRSELARHGQRGGTIAVTACLLPAGEALLLRHQAVWAACLRPGAGPPPRRSR